MYERNSARTLQISEAGYIVPIGNLESILKLGILSHERASALDHESLAELTVQHRRAQVTVNGLPLHRYVNLYLNPRNAMMYRIVRRVDRVAVVWVNVDSLKELSGVLVTDRNASVSNACWYPVSTGLLRLNYDAVFADRWSDGKRRNISLMQTMQAELLVPEKVDPTHFLRISVPTKSLAGVVPSTPMSVMVEPELFFT